jgi:hypothetical protein
MWWGKLPDGQKAIERAGKKHILKEMFGLHDMALLWSLKPVKKVCEFFVTQIKTPPDQAFLYCPQKF